MSSENTLTELFEHALKVAKLKKNTELEVWLSKELDGYPGRDVPEYRKVMSRSVCSNPALGAWIPLMFQKEELNEFFNDYPLKQSLRELEDAAKHAQPDGNIYFSFSQDLEYKLMQGSNMMPGMKPAVQIGLTVFKSMLARIKREFESKVTSLGFSDNLVQVTTSAHPSEQELTEVHPESEFLGMKGTMGSLFALAIVVIGLYALSKNFDIKWLDTLFEHDSVVVASVFCIHCLYVATVNWWRKRA